ncbi:MAG: hypothetical protein GY940_29515 [bacterium]|nr:hypothetical protein [bacterium]
MEPIVVSVKNELPLSKRKVRIRHAQAGDSLDGGSVLHYPGNGSERCENGFPLDTDSSLTGERKQDHLLITVMPSENGGIKRGCMITLPSSLDFDFTPGVPEGKEGIGVKRINGTTRLNIPESYDSQWELRVMPSQQEEELRVRSSQQADGTIVPKEPPDGPPNVTIEDDQ